MKRANVILTGFMGSGKTTLGIKLSYRIKHTFLDTDRMIEKETGQSISELFADKGEETFREMETQSLLRLLESSEKQIVSVGGGTPIREENRAILKELGTVIYLKTSPESIFERIGNDTKRPLLQGANPQETISRLLDEREEKYMDGADFVIVTDHKDTNELVDEIVDTLHLQ